MQTKTNKISLFLLVNLIFFIQFSMMTFYGENIFMVVSHHFMFIWRNGIMSYFSNLIVGEKFLRWTAASNSHFGQWIMALLLMVVMPIYIKIIASAGSKYKIFTNLWFLGLPATILCFLFEFTTGVLLNIWPLQLNIWDYSKYIYMNVLGQITWWYTPIWYSVGIFIFPLFRLLYNGEVEFAGRLRDEIKSVFESLFTKGGFMPHEYFKQLADEVLTETPISK